MLTLDLRLPRRGLTVEVALAVRPGQTLAVTGPSGCGKSSLLAAVAGLDRGTTGLVSADDLTWLNTARRIDPRRSAATAAWSSRTAPCSHT